MVEEELLETAEHQEAEGSRKKRRRSSFLANARRSFGLKREHLACLKEEEESSCCQKVRAAPWDPVLHFRFQVDVIRQLIPRPRKWVIFFGSLGTGIVGVRPKHPHTIRKPSVEAPGRSACARPEIRAAGYIVFFLNSPCARLQAWHGSTLGGYKPMLDLEQRKLVWETQRRDHKAKVIARVSEFVEAGAEVVVAVRGAPGDRFRILGRTSSFRLEAPSRFLLQKGDHVIVERGANRIHRCILPQCLDGGLKSGIALAPLVYPPSRGLSLQYCAACCRTRATASMVFEQLDEAAAGLLAPPRRGRRMRGKQPAPGAGKASSASDGACKAAPPAACKRERPNDESVEQPRATRRRRWRRSLLGRARGCPVGVPVKEEGAQLAHLLPWQDFSGVAKSPMKGDELLVEREALMERLAAVQWQLSLREMNRARVVGGGG